MPGTSSIFKNISLACDFSHWGQPESQIQSFVCMGTLSTMAGWGVGINLVSQTLSVAWH